MTDSDTPASDHEAGKVSAREMREIYEILTALEPQAAYSVAQAGLTKQQLAPLERATIDMEQALENDDLEAWAKADDRYHDELMSLHGNARLTDIVTRLSEQVHRARLLTLHTRRKPVRSTFEHRAIFDAIARGEAENAREFYARHRERSAAELLEILDRLEASKTRL